MDSRPIGVFDSGLGGLTAAGVLESILPGENLIYFGDSRNAPYGTRSREELLRLACANAEFLSGFDCKALLVACGTVSSNVMEELRGRVSVPVYGVLEAPCRRAAELTASGRVAVIATEATIRSGAFAARLQTLNPALQVYSKACQSFVALAEQGHFRAGDPLAEAAVAAELAPVRDFAPDVLLLACTHFPLFEASIAAYLGPGTKLISVGAVAAEELKSELDSRGMLADRELGSRRWFTSGSTEQFSVQGAILLGHPVAAEKHCTDEVGKI